jgi:hypothetical protein
MRDRLLRPIILPLLSTQPATILPPETVIGYLICEQVEARNGQSGAFRMKPANCFQRDLQF